MRTPAPPGTVKRSPWRTFMYGFALAGLPPLAYMTSPLSWLTRPTSSDAATVAAPRSAARLSIRIVFLMIIERVPLLGTVMVSVNMLHREELCHAQNDESEQLFTFVDVPAAAPPSSSPLRCPGRGRRRARRRGRARG